MPSKELPQPCQDCNDAEASVDVRRRRLCGDCFNRYVHSKILKRLESYRLKRSNHDVVRKVLLPLSGGISSLALLHTLDGQLRRQVERSRGRAAYTLHVLIVESPLLLSGPDAQLLAAARARYPSHTFSLISLSQLSQLDPEALDSIVAGQQEASEEDCIPEKSVESVFQSTSNPTAKADLLEVLLTKTIVAFAKKEGTESVFWGHSDSRLAARVLSSVAKGRGSAIPFQLLDGPTPWDISFHFPARELFKSELEMFAKTDSSFPSDMVIEDAMAVKPVSVRDQSIDQLITTYITSQGEKYPSIMANVVRTASKLRAPEVLPESRLCSLCCLPLETNSEAHAFPSLCYGCSRSRESVKLPKG